MTKARRSPRAFCISDPIPAQPRRRRRVISVYPVTRQSTSTMPPARVILTRSGRVCGCPSASGRHKLPESDFSPAQLAKREPGLRRRASGATVKATGFSPWKRLRKKRAFRPGPLRPKLPGCRYYARKGVTVTSAVRSRNRPPVALSVCTVRLQATSGAWQEAAPFASGGADSPLFVVPESEPVPQLRIAGVAPLSR